MLDVALGTPQWPAEAGAPIQGPPAVAGADIFVATSDGRLVAFPPRCGAASCTQDWEAPLDGTPTGAPIAGGDVGFVPVGTRIVAVGRDGCGNTVCTPLAAFDLGEPIPGGPVIDGGRLVVGTQSGRVVAFGLPG